MKKFVLSLLPICLLVVSINFNSFAQEKDQMISVHFQKVKPSKVMEYEKASKAFSAKLQENKVESVSYQAAMQEDFTYLYVVPIENMAHFDKPFWAEAIEKMGAENFSKAINGCEDCIESQDDHVYTRNADLSYATAGSGEDNTYARWSGYYFKPEKGEKAMKIAKKWKDWHSKHNSGASYSLYTGGLGAEAPMIVIFESAKDAAALNVLDQKIEAMMDEEGKLLREKTLSVVRKIEIKEGYLRPDLSYKYASDVIASDKE